MRRGADPPAQTTDHRAQAHTVSPSPCSTARSITDQQQITHRKIETWEGTQHMKPSPPAATATTTESTARHPGPRHGPQHGPRHLHGLDGEHYLEATQPSRRQLVRLQLRKSAGRHRLCHTAAFAAAREREWVCCVLTSLTWACVLGLCVGAEGLFMCTECSRSSCSSRFVTLAAPTNIAAVCSWPPTSG